MDELVQLLSEGNHPVIAGGPNPSIEQVRQSVDRGYVHIKFTDTRGGTDLGVRIDSSLTDLNNVDFDQAVGMAHLVGTLTLNYVNVRCIADLDLATLQGTGHLQIVE
jgi:Core binding factor beta subunit